MKTKRRKAYTSLQEWMEGTGTTAARLAAMAGISPPHLSKILSRSRRCSYEKAIRLHEVTGVPVENIVRWMTHDSREICSV